jgi:hypothetical protein
LFSVLAPWQLFLQFYKQFLCFIPGVLFDFFIKDSIAERVKYYLPFRIGQLKRALVTAHIPTNDRMIKFMFLMKNRCRGHLCRDVYKDSIVIIK